MPARFELGKLATRRRVYHVFDMDSDYPTLARCGTAHAANVEPYYVEFIPADTIIDLLQNVGPGEMCGRCRMSLVQELWRKYKKRR